jgi:hypothetical protein
MRKSFDVLWEVMEARRRQVEAGEVPPACRSEQTRQDRRRAKGCPDDEALCGWVDGQLRRNNLRRWITVWQHVQIRRCRECQAEIVAISAAMPHAQLQPAWLRSVLERFMAPSLLAKTPLAWASSALVIVVGLSLWSLGTHDAFQRVEDRPGPPLIEDMKALPPVNSGRTLDVQTEPTTIWGD